MGNRLSKIYTRTGDNGTTGLGDGQRVAKDSLRIQAIGDIDETNALIGLLLCEEISQEIRKQLIDIQHDLFDLGGEVCIPELSLITDKQIEQLEAILDQINAPLPALKDFILPGGCRPAALAHQARTVCRRAERSLVSLGQAETLNLPPQRYLNRLSDLLFVLARVLNRESGCGDVLWQKRKNA